MPLLRSLYLSLLTLPIAGLADSLLDGVWCSDGKNSMIQWESHDYASQTEKDQFCIMLKTTKSGKGTMVGRGITTYKNLQSKVDPSAGLRKDKVFYDASVFAFSSHQDGYRLVMVDVTDTTLFDLRFGADDTLQGFVIEKGSVKKTKSRNAFAGYLYFVKSGALPEDFDQTWHQVNKNTHA